MVQNELLTIIRLFKRALPLKELPRTGWIMEGAARGDSDSVAAHSYSVALISFLTAWQLGKNPKFAPIKWDRVLAMATLHDLAESVTGEHSSGFKAWIATNPGRGGLFDQLEQEVLEYLLKDIDHNQELTALVREFDDCRTKEAKVVKFADIVDAFAHAKVRLKQTFELYLSRSEAKLRKHSPEHDAGVGNQLAEWLSDIQKEWDSINPAPIC